MQQTESAYRNTIPLLLPRPALVLFSYVTSALYLLEHASWAHKAGEAAAGTDAEVFRRWVDEGGFKSAMDEVERVSKESDGRANRDSAIVYGTALPDIRAHL